MARGSRRLGRPAIVQSPRKRRNFIIFMLQFDNMSACFAPGPGLEATSRLRRGTQGSGAANRRGTDRLKANKHSLSSMNCTHWWIPTKRPWPDPDSRFPLGLGRRVAVVIGRGCVGTWAGWDEEKSKGEGTGNKKAVVDPLQTEDDEAASQMCGPLGSILGSHFLPKTWWFHTGRHEAIWI